MPRISTVTNKVEEVLIENIRSYPHNLKASFRLTSRKTGVTEEALRMHYYRHVRNHMSLFTLLSNKGLLLNVKRSAAVKETKRTLYLKQKMSNISTLTTQEKADLLDLLLG